MASGEVILPPSMEPQRQLPTMAWPARVLPSEPVATPGEFDARVYRRIVLRSTPATNGFEVLADKCIPTEGAAKVFAFVGRVGEKPKRRVHEVLQSQGVVARQQVTFLSDGGDSAKNLLRFLHPPAVHSLDWFCVATRIEQLLQIARGRQPDTSAIGRDVHLERLQRLK